MRDTASSHHLVDKLSIVLVANYDSNKARDWIQENRTNLPFYLDGDLSVYNAFGLNNSVKLTWESSLWHLKMAITTGHSITIPQKDDDQKRAGGDVIVDKEGKVVYMFKGLQAHQRPTVKELTEFLHYNK